MTHFTSSWCLLQKKEWTTLSWILFPTDKISMAKITYPQSWSTVDNQWESLWIPNLVPVFFTPTFHSALVNIFSNHDNPKWNTFSTQFSSDSCLTTLHHRGQIARNEDGVWFQCDDPILCRLKNDITFTRSKDKVEGKVQPDAWHWPVSRIIFRKPSRGDDGSVSWSQMDINNDDDIRKMLHRDDLVCQWDSLPYAWACDRGERLIWGVNEIFFLMLCEHQM